MTRPELLEFWSEKLVGAAKTLKGEIDVTPFFVHLGVRDHSSEFLFCFAFL
jgi:hypothetical protein